ncbi:hypothetical protein [Alteromonas sp. P256]
MTAFVAMFEPMDEYLKLAWGGQYRILKLARNQAQAAPLRGREFQHFLQ